MIVLSLEADKSFVVLTFVDWTRKEKIVGLLYRNIVSFPFKKKERYKYNPQEKAIFKKRSLFEIMGFKLEYREDVEKVRQDKAKIDNLLTHSKHLRQSLCLIKDRVITLQALSMDGYYVSLYTS